MPGLRKADNGPQRAVTVLTSSVVRRKQIWSLTFPQPTGQDHSSIYNFSIAAL